MKLRTRILLAGLPLVASLVGVAAYSTTTTLRLGGMADRIVKDNYRSVLAAQRMESELDAAERLFAASSGEEVALTGSMGPCLAAFERSLALQEDNITEAGEAEATRDLRSSYEKWREAARAAGAIVEPRERWRAYVGRVVPASAAVRGDTDRILAINHDAMIRKSVETEHEAADVSRNLALAGLLALGLSVLAGFALSDRIARPLARLAESARRVGEGDLDVALDERPGEDEVARLLREFRGMTEKLRTYRKSSLGDLLEATEEAQAAIDSLADPVLAFDADAAFRRANGAARALLGVDPDLDDPLSPISAELRSAIATVRDRVLKGKGPQTPRGLENTIPLLSEGRPIYVQPLATPIYAEASGAVVGVTVLLRDVTSLRRANELKNDLLSTVAHELRTPLTSIRMGLHLCLEEAVGPLGEKQKELLHTAREDAERLHRVVEGILSVSKIEAGVLVGRRRAVAPRTIVEEAVAPFRIAASDRKIALTAVSPEAPLVEVDQDSVVLVLANMLRNALKHTPEGGRIDVAVAADGEWVRFSVADTGSGIPEEHRPRLFEKFYRVPGSPPGGTGLGLSIARDIVFAHEGEIGVESEVGKGSRFWFRLLASKAPTTASDESPAHASDSSDAS